MIENRELCNFSIKRYAGGKYNLSTTGDPAYRGIAETALKQSVEIGLFFDREQFLEIMQTAGVPEEISREFADNLLICNEVYSDDTMR